MNQPPYRYPPRGIPQFPDFSPENVARGRPPGTPANAPGPPRLPELPAPPYDPPIVPLSPADAPQARQGLTDLSADYESTSQSVLFNAGDMAKPVHVYTTTRRWRGVDVFLSIDPTIEIGPRPNIAGDDGSAALSVQLWAIDRGVRTLVATGRYGAVDQGVVGGSLTAGRSPNSPKRMIAYRGPAEKFEVTAYANWTVVAPVNFPPATPGTAFTAQVAIIATDQAVPIEADDEPGTIPTSTGVARGALQIGDIQIFPDNPDNTGAAYVVGIDFSPIEIVWLFMASSVAGRWLQVFASPPAAGQRPIASFGPVALGGFSQPIRFPKGFRFRGTGFGLYWSSTAATYTAAGAGDNAAVAWYR